MRVNVSVAAGAVAAVLLLSTAGCDVIVDGGDLERHIERLDPAPLAQAGGRGVTAVHISAFMDESVTLLLTVDHDDFDGDALCRVLHAYVNAAPSWSTMVLVDAVDAQGTAVDIAPEAAALGLYFNDALQKFTAPWVDVERATASCG